MIVTVNGSEVDVVKSSVNLTFQSNELNEIKNRNLSNTRLRFPKTPRNMEAFSYLSAQGSTSTVPYDIVPCEIKDGNVRQIKGVLKITSIKSDMFEGILKDSAGDIFDLIKEKDLKDLDFSDLNHYLNNTTYLAAVNSNDEYTYPLANYGEELGGTVNINRQSPAFFKHYLWSKIWSEVGAYYSGDFFDDSNFKNEVVGMAKGQLDTGKALEQGLSQGQSITYESTLTTYDLDSTFLPLSGSDNHIDDRLKVHEDGRIEVLSKCKILLSHTFQSEVRVSTFSTVVGGITSQFDIKENGVSLYSHTGTASISNVATATWIGSVEHSVNFYALAEVGDIYTFETSSVATSNQMPANGVKVNNNSLNSYLEILEPFIDFNDLIGDMSQTDFIKDVISSNGLMFRVVTPVGLPHNLGANDLVYEFITMEDLLNDRTNAEDWTDKKNITKASKTEIGKYGVNNILKYEYAEDVVSFLDYNHISTNLNQKTEEDLYSSLYEVSRVSGSFMGVDTLNPKTFELIEVEEYGGAEGEQYLSGYHSYYKAIEGKNRASKVRLNSKTYSIIDGNGATISVSGLTNYLTNDKVGMDFYYNRYFKAFSRVLDKPIKDTMSLYLSPLDIHKLDFFKLKYMSQDGRYYYLNKVTKFKEGINTLCELVAVIGNESNDYECEDYIYNNYATNIYTA